MIFCTILPPFYNHYYPQQSYLKLYLPFYFLFQKLSHTSFFLHFHQYVHNTYLQLKHKQFCHILPLLKNTFLLLYSFLCSIHRQFLPLIELFQDFSYFPDKNKHHQYLLLPHHFLDFYILLTNKATSVKYIYSFIIPSFQSFYSFRFLNSVPNPAILHSSSKNSKYPSQISTSKKIFFPSFK